MTATEKIVKVMDDKDFCEKLEGLSTEEEVKSAFEAQGITDADVAELSGIGDELSDGDLEDVSGGMGWTEAVFRYGLPMVKKLWECNKYTAWGTNGKKCKCGYHAKVKGALGIK